jgi:hypothetical protein
VPDAWAAQLLPADATLEQQLEFFYSKHNPDKATDAKVGWLLAFTQPTHLPNHRPTYQRAYPPALLLPAPDAAAELFLPRHRHLFAGEVRLCAVRLGIGAGQGGGAARLPHCPQKHPHRVRGNELPGEEVEPKIELELEVLRELEAGSSLPRLEGGSATPEPCL